MKNILLESLKVAIPLAVAALVYGITVFAKHTLAKKGAGAAAQAAVDRACAEAKKLLDQMLYGAVTEAEFALGSGTGAVKLDIVREKALALLPESIRALVPADWLQRVIEVGLDAAKKKWAANKALESLVKTPEPVKAGVPTEDAQGYEEYAAQDSDV